MGAYYLHGIMSSVQATYLFFIMSAWTDSLNNLTSIFTTIAYIVASLNFITYLPSFIIWLVTFSNRPKSYLNYYRALRYTDVAGWFMFIVNLAGWIVLILVALFDGLFTSIQELDLSIPSFILPTVGFSLDICFQVMYSITYGYNRNLMKCWAFDYPQLGECSYV